MEQPPEFVWPIEDRPGRRAQLPGPPPVSSIGQALDDDMKKALLAVTAALALSACAEDMGYGPYFGGDTAYYDDYYGPFYNGYWGAGDVFYYSTGRGRPYFRDEGRHFRHDRGGDRWHGVRTHPGWVGRHGDHRGDYRGDHRGDHRWGDHDRDR
jgi:hypothetical protein